MYIMQHKKLIQSLYSVTLCSIGFMWIIQLKTIASNRYFYLLEYLSNQGPLFLYVPLVIRGSESFFSVSQYYIWFVETETNGELDEEYFLVWSMMQTSKNQNGSNRKFQGIIKIKLVWLRILGQVIQWKQRKQMTTQDPPLANFTNGTARCSLTLKL